MDPWIDERHLKPGTNFRDEIDRQVRSSDVVLIFVSQASVLKDSFLQDEIRFAIEAARADRGRGPAIIPVMLELCELPGAIADLHAVRLFERNGYDVLLDHLPELELRDRSSRSSSDTEPRPGVSLELDRNRTRIETETSDNEDDINAVLVSDSGVRYPRILWSDPVPPGPFPMGNSGADAKYEDEKPRFSCDLIGETYAVGLYPITVAQYQLFVDAGGYEQPCDACWTRAGLDWRRTKKIDGPETYRDPFGRADHPQVGVCWYEAVAFCNWLSGLSGLPIQLPTEPQWERAARHTDARKYPWAAPNEMPGQISDHANVFEAVGHTSAVTAFPSGAAVCGAMDMSGNVWEWCSSKGTGNYDSYETEHDADPGGTSARVLRGGSWHYGDLDARCAFRNRYHPNLRDFNLGFRVCVSPFSTSGL